MNRRITTSGYRPVKCTTYLKYVLEDTVALLRPVGYWYLVEDEQPTLCLGGWVGALFSFSR